MPDYIVCPTDCGTTLPPVKFDLCAPEIRLSEIQNVAVGNANAAPFTLVTDPTEWATRLDQSATTGDKIRMLTGIGSIPAPADTVQTISKNRTRITRRVRTLTLVIDEMNNENYDFVRTIECGGQSFRIWPITDDGKELLGGNDGILASATAVVTYDTGEGAIQKATITFTWNSLQSPPRALNPIAGF